MIGMVILCLSYPLGTYLDLFLIQILSRLGKQFTLDFGQVSKNARFSVGWHRSFSIAVLFPGPILVQEKGWTKANQDLQNGKVFTGFVILE